MTELHLSAEEREHGLSGERLQCAVEAMHNDGFVVLHDAVHPEHIEILRDRVLEDVETIVKRPDAPFNFNTGNVQQDPPPHHPYLFRDILFNEAAISVTHAIFGDGVQNSFYSGNTAIPGGTRQPVHPDVPQLWPNLQNPTPAFGIVINVPLVDFTAENGATELWPGTHHDTSFYVAQGSARVSEDHLAKWRDRGPIRMCVPAGSLVLRDIRMWHAGMPNETSTPRPMVAMIHWVGWWKDVAPIKFPESAREFLEHPILKTNTQFVAGDVNYLAHGEAYDLEK